MKSIKHLLFHTVSYRRTATSSIPTGTLVIRRLFLCILLGVALGTAWLACDTVPTYGYQGLAVSTEPQTLWTLCCRVAKPLLLLWICCLASGFSAIGQPIPLLMLLLRGVAIGAAIAQCFLQYGLAHGLPIVGLCILPLAFSTSWILVLAARDALRLSGQTAGYLFSGKPHVDIKDMTRTYVIKFLAWLVMLLAASVLHSLMFAFVYFKLHIP